MRVFNTARLLVCDAASRARCTTMGQDASRDVYVAAKKGDVDAIADAIGRGGDVNAAVNGQTALAAAASGGNYDAVRHLLDANALDVPHTHNKMTALHEATKRNHGRVVELLLDRGADRWHRDGKGRTAYEVALKHDHVQVARMFENKSAAFTGYLELRKGGFFKSWSRKYAVLLRPLPEDNPEVDRSQIFLLMFKNKLTTKVARAATLTGARIVDPRDSHNNLMLNVEASGAGVNDFEMVTFKLRLSEAEGSESIECRATRARLRRIAEVLSDDFVVRGSVPHREGSILDRPADPARDAPAAAAVPAEPAIPAEDPPEYAVAAAMAGAAHAGGAHHGAVPVAIDDAGVVIGRPGPDPLRADAVAVHPLGVAGAEGAAGGFPVPPSSHRGAHERGVAAGSAAELPGAISFEGLDDAALEEMPDYFVCPLTLEPMGDPVVASDGRSYERASIASWVSNHSSSPITNEPIDSRLIVNWTLRQQIADWVEKKRAELEEKRRVEATAQREAKAAAEEEAGLAAAIAAVASMQAAEASAASKIQALLRGIMVRRAVRRLKGETLVISPRPRGGSTISEERSGPAASPKSSRSGRATPSDRPQSAGAMGGAGGAPSPARSESSVATNPLAHSLKRVELPDAPTHTVRIASAPSPASPEEVFTEEEFAF